MVCDEGQLTVTRDNDGRRPMTNESAVTYLDLKVGRFRLALGADHVLGILGDVAAGDSVTLRGDRLPLLDLHSLFTREHRDPIPFVVAFECEAGRVAVGVDRVDHLRLESSTILVALPRFGLRMPKLFSEALRDDKGILLVLDPVSLAKLSLRPELAV